MTIEVRIRNTANASPLLIQIFYATGEKKEKLFPGYMPYIRLLLSFCFVVYLISLFSPERYNLTSTVYPNADIKDRNNSLIHHLEDPGCLQS